MHNYLRKHCCAHPRRKKARARRASFAAKASPRPLSPATNAEKWDFGVPVSRATWAGPPNSSSNLISMARRRARRGLSGFFMPARLRALHRILLCSMLRSELRISHNKAMNLRTFLDSLPRGGISEFAGKVSISPIYLSQLAAGQDQRVPSPELCVVLWRASGGVVTRWDLRPKDWHLIWPELIGTPGAPGVPQAESATTVAS